MNSTVKNVLAVIAGLLLGAVINSGILKMGMWLIPIPEGADVNTPEGLAASIQLFQPKHYITPFLAHAIGTFAGAMIAIKLGASHHLRLALIVAVFFLMGGIYMVSILSAPLWFNVLDLVGAYLPMAYLAGKLMNVNP